MAYYRIVHETIILYMIPHDYVTGLYQQDCTLYIYQYDYTHYIDRTVHIIPQDCTYYSNRNVHIIPKGQYILYQ